MGSAFQDDVQQPLVELQQSTAALSSSHSVYAVTSDELERILSDDNGLSVVQRYSRATWMELKLLLYLAAPMVFVYMISYLMSMFTQMFAGHLGNLQLAAASLGNTGVQLFAYGLMVFTFPPFSHFLVHCCEKFEIGVY